MRSILVLLLLTSGAAADDTVKPIADGYELVLTGQNLDVRKGKQRTRIDKAASLSAVRFDPKTKLVTADIEDAACVFHQQRTWSLPYLQARLENDPAYALHRKKDYKGAIAGFERAAAADPAWPIAAYNLASAHQLLGDRDAAMRVLAPWLASHPARTYVQIATDPELSPLLARPELAAIRKTGNVTVTWRGIDGTVAYSPDHKLIALARSEGGWGASVFFTQLEIYDAGGKLVTTTPLVAMDETAPDCYEAKGCELLPAARTKVAARAAHVQQILRDLGFVKATGELGTGSSDDGVKRKLGFARHKLGLVAMDGKFRVLRGNTELAAGGILDRLESAMIVDDIHAVVAWSIRPGAEGCESTDPTQVTIVPLAP